MESGPALGQCHSARLPVSDGAHATVHTRAVHTCDRHPHTAPRTARRARCLPTPSGDGNGLLARGLRVGSTPLALRPNAGGQRATQLAAAQGCLDGFGSNGGHSAPRAADCDAAHQRGTCRRQKPPSLGSKPFPDTVKVQPRVGEKG